MTADARGLPDDVLCEAESFGGSPRIACPQRRRSTLRILMPLLIVLLVAASALEYRRRRVDWGGLELAVAGEATRRSEPVAPEPRPVPKALTSPVSLATPDVRPFKTAPAGMGPATPPPPCPPETLVAAIARHRDTVDAAAAIRREALARSAERVRMEGLLDILPEIEDRRAEQLRRARLQRAVREANASRVDFHRALSERLSRKVPGIEIVDWNNGLIGERFAELEAAAVEALDDDRRARGDARRRIMLYRSLGLPEPLILNDLLRGEMKKINARGGPRSIADAMNRAARRLLAMPPEPVVQAVSAVGPRGS